METEEIIVNDENGYNTLKSEVERVKKGKERRKATGEDDMIGVGENITKKLIQLTTGSIKLESGQNISTT